MGFGAFLMHLLACPDPTFRGGETHLFGDPLCSPYSLPWEAPGGVGGAGMGVQAQCYCFAADRREGVKSHTCCCCCCASAGVLVLLLKQEGVRFFFFFNL